MTAIAMPRDAYAMHTRWLALLSAFLGYTFDCMDLVVFNLIQIPSMRELLGAAETPAGLQEGANLIIACKLFGWTIGGAIFGNVADRIGRKSTMIVSILIYGSFTALSGVVGSYGQLLTFQIVAGIGIGAEWAAGASLVSETWSGRKRNYAMALVQSSFAFGFLAATFFNLWMQRNGFSWHAVLIVAGAVPILFLVPIRSMTPESGDWIRAERKGSLGDIMKPGVLWKIFLLSVMTSAYMVGSWGGLTPLPGWIRVLADQSKADFLQSLTTFFVLAMGAGIPGYFLVAFLTNRVNHGVVYAIFATGGLGASWYMFTQLHTLEQVVMFAPVYGTVVMGGFGVFGIILPQQFPTAIRATCIAFCYNVGRGLTGIGVLYQAGLIRSFESLPNAGARLSWAYGLGLIPVLLLFLLAPQVRDVQMSGNCPLPRRRSKELAPES